MAQAVQQTIMQNNKSIGQTVIQKVSQLAGNASLKQKVQNIGEAITKSIQESSDFGSFIPILIGAVAVALILYVLFGRKKSGDQDIIGLIGERYSGKTQLFMKINGGKCFQTVPSIKNNHTTFKVPSSRKTYRFIDYTGDGISKDQVLNSQNYQNIHTIIQVVDGTDPSKLGDSALFIYRLLVSKSFQKRECNYVLFLNKNDQQNFLTKAKIVKRIQDEIQHIKQSRKNSPQQSQQEQDYLKTSRQRFDLSKTAIKIAVGTAAQKDGCKQLQNILEETL